MRSIKKYYVVDTVAQTVIGSFDAISPEMAKVVYKKSILENDKLKDSAEQFHCLVQNEIFDILETYDEVLENCSDFVVN